MPITMLIQQLLGPLLLHLLSRPLMSEGAGRDLPDLDEACAGFAGAFVRAVGLPDAPPPVSPAPFETKTEPKGGQS